MEENVSLVRTAMKRWNKTENICYQKRFPGVPGIQWCSPRDRSLGLETTRDRFWRSWSWSWSQRIGLEYFLSRPVMHLAICWTFVYDHLFDQL